MITDPYQYPRVWDKVRIASTRNPGIAKVGKFPRKWKWDKKSGKGTQGETNTYNGQYLATGTIMFQLLYGPDPKRPGQLLTELEDWYTFSQLFSYDPTKNAQQNAVSIFHPSLAMIGVYSVVCEELGNVVLKDVGLFEVECTFSEFRPPPPVAATSTPKGAKTDSGGSPGKPAPGTATDPADVILQKQIAAQLAIAQKPL